MVRFSFCKNMVKDPYCTLVIFASRKFSRILAAKIREIREIFLHAKISCSTVSKILNNLNHCRLVRKQMFVKFGTHLKVIWDELMTQSIFHFVTSVSHM